MKSINVNEIDLDALEDEKLKAILICLLTDAEVDTEELPEDAEDTGGYWGDDYDIIVAGKKTKYSLGSKIWVLMLGKLDDDVIKLLQQYVVESLSILIDADVITEPQVWADRTDDTATLLLIFENETISLEGWE